MPPRATYSAACHMLLNSSRTSSPDCAWTLPITATSRAICSISSSLRYLKTWLTDSSPSSRVSVAALRTPVSGTGATIVVISAVLLRDPHPHQARGVLRLFRGELRQAAGQHRQLHPLRRLLVGRGLELGGDLPFQIANRARLVRGKRLRLDRHRGDRDPPHQRPDEREERERAERDDAEQATAFVGLRGHPLPQGRLRSDFDRDLLERYVLDRQLVTARRVEPNRGGDDRLNLLHVLRLAGARGVGHAAVSALR